MIHIHTQWPLLLLALLPPLWWMARRSTRFRRQRKTVLQLLSALSLLCLLMALAQPTWLRRERRISLACLVDVSASISDAQHQQAQSSLAALANSLSEGDRVAFVTFGSQASVMTDWMSRDELRGHSVAESRPQQASSIETALRTGAALLGSGSGRLLLLSDGLENHGNVERMFPLLRASGIPVDVLPLEAPNPPEVVLTQARYPHEVPPDKSIPVKLSVTSTEAMQLEIQVAEEGTIVQQETVPVGQGPQLLQIQLPPASAGVHRYRIRLSASRDTYPINNEAIAQIRVSGPPSVLYASTIEPSPFHGVVPQLEKRPPSQLPQTPSGYTDYQALVLDNVPEDQLDDAQKQAIIEAVRISGLGLVALGSKSLGPGGYLDTPLEDLLPVTLTPPEKQQPKAIVLVVDRSGSMGGKSGSDTKISLARSAVASAIRALRPEDQVGVIAFDAEPHILIPMQTADAPEKLMKQLSALEAGYGTHMQSALEQAAGWLESTGIERRYLIVLSDGKISENDNPQVVVERLSRQKVQTSAISLGTSPLMQRLAEIGTGRYHVVGDLRSLPQVLVDEVRQSEEAIKTGIFTPHPIVADPVLTGLANWPTTYGYVRSQLRSGAQTLLEIEQDQPLLASWRYGTGRVVTFHSDLTSIWGRAWLRWPLLNRFCQQLIDGVISGAESEALSVTLKGTEAVLQIGFPVTRGDVVLPNGETQSFAFHTNGGQWTGTVGIEQPGDYIFSVNGQRLTLPVAYPPEWAEVGTNEAFLHRIAEQTGGLFRPGLAEIARRPHIPETQTQELWRSLLWLGVILFITGVAARHISVRRILPRRPERAVESHRSLTRLRATQHRDSYARSSANVTLHTRTDRTVPSVPEIPLTSQLLTLKRREQD